MKMKHILRWLSIIPISIIIQLIATFFLHLILYKSLTSSGFITPYPELPERILTPFVMQYTTIRVAYFIAPKFHFKTALIISVFIGILSILSFIIGYFEIYFNGIQFVLNYYGLGIIFGLIGNLLAIYHLKKNDGYLDVLNDIL